MLCCSQTQLYKYKVKSHSGFETQSWYIDFNPSHTANIYL